MDISQCLSFSVAQSVDELELNGIMDQIPADSLLKFNATTLEEIRRCWDLDDGRVNQSIDILEEWIAKQNHFVNKKFSRDYLERCLVACKGSVEKSKTTIDKLCTLKTLLPKFFVAGNVRETLGNIADISWLVPLPKMTKDNYRVYVVKIHPKQLTSSHFLEFYQLSFVICEYLKRHDYANGFIIVDDFRETNLVDIITKVNLVEFQQYMTIMIEGFGARIKGIYLLTESKVIDVFIKTFKPMLSAKIGDRITVLKDVEELHRVVDKDLLPVEYGGNERSTEKLKDEWLDVISSEEHEEYLAEMKASCTDESLRTTDKFNEQHMGLPGSFRTLTVD